jgi:hypothetical protein
MRKAVFIMKVSKNKISDFLKGRGFYLVLAFCLIATGVAAWTAWAGSTAPDTMTVTGLDGEKLFLMKSVVDSAGNVYGSETLSGVIVTARFKNIAERNGKVNLAFDVHIPKEMQNPSWQLRFQPKLYIMEDTLDMEDIYVTGSEYSRIQLRGYEQYARFLSSIITDSTQLRHQNLLEIFIQRNIPTLAALRSDSSFVSDREMEGLYGITYHQVLDYYKRNGRIGRNNLRSRKAPRMYDRYIKNPFSCDAIRLDTIISTPDEITYCYTQTINTRPRLKKVDITLSGEIMQNGKSLYTMEEGRPLTFYISSISTFMEEKTRYINKIIERRAQSNTHAYIDFEQGKCDIDPNLHENSSELSRISRHIHSLILNETFDIDSLVITASSSPEGPYTLNSKLSAERAEAIEKYFTRYARTVSDSLRHQEGNTIFIDMSKGSEELTEHHSSIDFEFKVHSIAEDWEKLESIIRADTSLTDKAGLLAIFNSGMQPDETEWMLQRSPDYKYIREKIYPKLRTVMFDFHMHRKGMVKDTIHTTVADEQYAQGLDALRERDYEKAIGLLRPYGDINTAVAYLSLDYNASAKAILKKLPDSAKKDYMLAIIYVREGADQKAVQSFIDSVTKDPSMKFRANLDPEMSQLIKKYGIVLEEDEPSDDFSY